MTRSMVHTMVKSNGVQIAEEAARKNTAGFGNLKSLLLKNEQIDDLVC